MMGTQKTNPAGGQAERGGKAQREAIYSAQFTPPRPFAQTIDTLLSRLEHVRQNGDQKWMARCAAHPDRNPSLSIRASGERILIHCFAGCDTGDVLAAVGLSWRDILPPRSPEERRSYAASARLVELEQARRAEMAVVTVAEASTVPLNADDRARLDLARRRIAALDRQIEVTR